MFYFQPNTSLNWGDTYYTFTASQFGQEQFGNYARVLFVNDSYIILYNDNSKQLVKMRNWKTSNREIIQTTKLSNYTSYSHVVGSAFCDGRDRITYYILTRTASTGGSLEIKPVEILADGDIILGAAFTVGLDFASVRDICDEGYIWNYNDTLWFSYGASNIYKQAVVNLNNKTISTYTAVNASGMGSYGSSSGFTDGPSGGIARIRGTSYGSAVVEPMLNNGSGVATGYDTRSINGSSVTSIVNAGNTNFIKIWTANPPSGTSISGARYHIYCNLNYGVGNVITSSYGTDIAGYYQGSFEDTESFMYLLDCDISMSGGVSSLKFKKIKVASVPASRTPTIVDEKTISVPFNVTSLNAQRYVANTAIATVSPTLAFEYIKWTPVSRWIGYICPLGVIVIDPLHLFAED